MAKISDEMIKEINELAHKSKTIGLTDEEKERQQELSKPIYVLLEVVLNNNLKI